MKTMAHPDLLWIRRVLPGGQAFIDDVVHLQNCNLHLNINTRGQCVDIHPIPYHLDSKCESIFSVLQDARPANVTPSADWITLRRLPFQYCRATENPNRYQSQTEQLPANRSRGWASLRHNNIIIIWLLHNLVEASFDLFRYLLLGDQLKPWEHVIHMSNMRTSGKLPTCTETHLRDLEATVAIFIAHRERFSSCAVGEPGK